MAYLKTIAVRGVMQVLEVPEGARWMYRDCPYIVRSLDTGQTMKEFQRQADAVRWAERHRTRSSYDATGKES